MAKIKLRRDTYQNWYDANPVLALGEPAYDTTNNKVKIGDGTSRWGELSYLNSASSGGSSDSLVNGPISITLNNEGALVFPAGGKHYDLSGGSSILSHNIEVNTQVWSFGYDGILTLPYNNYLETIDTNLQIGSGGDVTIRSNAASNLTVKQLVFNSAGALQFPGNEYGVFQIVPAQNTYVTASTPTIVFTGTQYVETMKATIQVIDNSASAVNGISTYNTQLCEILVVKQRVYNANIDATSFTVEAMVYGVVHTSLTPMATFDAQWNALTNQIEITMVKDAAYTALTAKVMATESINLAP
jgi:hypothetical protein